MSNKFRLLRNEKYIAEEDPRRALRGDDIFHHKEYLIVYSDEIIFQYKVILPAWSPIYRFNSDSLFHAHEIYLNHIKALAEEELRYKICSEDVI